MSSEGLMMVDEHLWIDKPIYRNTSKFATLFKSLLKSFALHLAVLWLRAALLPLLPASNAASKWREETERLWWCSSLETWSSVWWLDGMDFDWLKSAIHFAVHVYINTYVSICRLYMIIIHSIHFEKCSPSLLFYATWFCETKRAAAFCCFFLHVLHMWWQVELALTVATSCPLEANMHPLPTQ